MPRNISAVLFAIIACLCIQTLAAQVEGVTGGKKPTLPRPYATSSSGNPADLTEAPKGFLPTVPEGFQVNRFAEKFDEPRWLAVAPNGDVFVAESGAGKVVILRDPQHTGGAQQREVFESGFNRPYGIAFHENYVYIGSRDEITRFVFDPKTSNRLGEKEHILSLPSGGHWTRSLAFTADGKHLLIGVGSDSNVGIEPEIRAAITICDLDGKHARIFASGLRNPGGGLAIEPKTGQVWTSVNERDGLGDDLPPDYITSVRDGGFYGWPYSYIGDNADDRVSQQRPDLVAKAIVPDVLVGAHVAALQFAFYTGTQFPEKYRGGIFLAEHGSWNRSVRQGYQVVFIPMKDGRPTGGPEVFFSGFVPDANKRQVYGQPVGVAVASDGALLVSDDGAGVIWRISNK